MLLNVRLWELAVRALWLFLCVALVVCHHHNDHHSPRTFASRQCICMRLSWNFKMGVPSIVIVQDLFLAVAFALIWPMLPTGTIYHVLCISDFDLMRRVILSRFFRRGFPRLKNLEIAGDLHVGARKTLILAQMLCEQLIPTFIGLVMAYSALFILIGTMNPTPSDSLAIFLLELHDGLPLPCATAMGTAIAVILIREKDLFRLFKTR